MFGCGFDRLAAFGCPVRITCEVSRLSRRGREQMFGRGMPWRSAGTYMMMMVGGDTRFSGGRVGNQVRRLYYHARGGLSAGDAPKERLRSGMGSTGMVGKMLPEAPASLARIPSASAIWGFAMNETPAPRRAVPYLACSRWRAGWAASRKLGYGRPKLHIHPVAAPACYVCSLPHLNHLNQCDHSAPSTVIYIPRSYNIKSSHHVARLMPRPIRLD